jgi:predicted ATPase
LLSRTSDVRILATSRQVLGAPGERLVWLAPLEVPPRDAATTAEEVLRYSAPQLLVTRAFEKSGYVLTDVDAAAVAEICRQLDGAPLALELISSRLIDQNAGATLEKLDDRFRNLRKHSPGSPLRHQTLLATLEWSYSLLGPDEACVLRAISIFAGHFDAQDVIRVVAHLRLTPEQTRGAIAALFAKSMLSLDGTSTETRYRLLDTTRAFARELLDDSGELAAVSENHARLQLDALTGAENPHPRMPARDGRADDLRKALDWALHRNNDPLLGIQLAAAGLPLWHELSLGEECRRHCARALAEFERIGCSDVALKLKLVVGLASTSTFLSADAEATMALFETAIRLARETADAAAECRALGALAIYKILPGNEGAVTELLDQMSEAAERSKDQTAMWEHEQLRAEWELNCCQYSASLRRLDRLRAEMRDELDGTVPRFQIDQRTNIETQYGALCWFMGQPGRAVEVIEQAARRALETRHGLTLIHCFSRGIIFTLTECHFHARARAYAKLLRSAIDRHGMAAWIPIADCWTACIDALSGELRSPQVVWTAFENLWQGSVQLGHHVYYALLARAMIALGQIDASARIVDLIFEAGVHRAVLPEFLRIRAAAERAFARDEQARETLARSVQLADEIGCLGWKLRSAVDLATLLCEQGEAAGARQVLAPVYAQFADGFDTGDLRNARALLEKLPATRTFGG